MTERRDLGAARADLATASHELRDHRLKAHIRHHARTWRVGLPILGSGAALTWASTIWAAGGLGFLALIMVFGGLFWIALGVMRGAYARMKLRER